MLDDLIREFREKAMNRNLPRWAEALVLGLGLFSVPSLLGLTISPTAGEHSRYFIWGGIVLGVGLALIGVALFYKSKATLSLKKEWGDFPTEKH